MPEFPQRITVPLWNKNAEGWQAWFDCQYVKERERLGLEPDLFVSKCPLCLKNEPRNQTNLPEVS